MDSQKREPCPMDALNLTGKVVFITGGAGGFGQAFVNAFLDKGAKVCLTDINTESGNKVVEELATEHGSSNIKFCVCDVTKDDSFAKAISYCVENLGTIDILVNNAGIGNECNWKLTMDINVGGTIRGTELAIKHMSKEKGNKGGHVINTASISGVKVIPFGPFYSASKSAIVQYTRTAGHPFHFAYTGVNIKCLCPSLVDTPLLKTSTPAYTPQSAAAIKKLYASFPLMGTDEIVSALFKLLEDNKPGSVLIVQKGKEPYYNEPSLV